jgi:hypothetical protein
VWQGHSEGQVSVPAVLPACRLRRVAVADRPYLIGGEEVVAVADAIRVQERHSLKDAFWAVGLASVHRLRGAEGAEGAVGAVRAVSAVRAVRAVSAVRAGSAVRAVRGTLSAVRSRSRRK